MCIRLNRNRYIKFFFDIQLLPLCYLREMLSNNYEIQSSFQLVVPSNKIRRKIIKQKCKLTKIKQILHDEVQAVDFHV